MKMTIKILFTVQFAITTATVTYTMSDYQISFISKKKKKRGKARLKENW